MDLTKILDWVKGLKSTNAISLLKEDHKKVSKLLKEAENTDETNGQTRKQLFFKIKTELQTHTKLEETLFYPRLEKFSETREITLEAYHEHDLVDKLLAELETIDVTSENWKGKFTVLKENVEHHVEEEENDMFPKVKKVISNDELEDIGKEMEKLKVKIKSEKKH